VPEHLRDAHYQGAKKLGHGTDYKYSHDSEEGWVQQTYLPEDRRYYQPVDRGYEKVIRERLEQWRKLSSAKPGDGSTKRKAAAPGNKQTQDDSSGGGASPQR
jgi:putative ATPase